MKTPTETIEQGRERAEYLAAVAERGTNGSKRIKLTHHLAHILGLGNERGYSDWKAGKPAEQFDPETTDAVFILGYNSGYQSGAKGKMPQMIWLRSIGFDMNKLEVA